METLIITGGIIDPIISCRVFQPFGWRKSVDALSLNKFYFSIPVELEEVFGRFNF